MQFAAQRKQNAWRTRPQLGRRERPFMVADDHDSWDPEKLRPRPLRSIVGWIIAAISVYVAAGLVPGVAVDGTRSAFLIAAVDRDLQRDRCRRSWRRCACRSPCCSASCSC